MNESSKRAFTIVELVIVIAVIAILAAVLIPTFSTVIRKAKDSYFLQNKRNEWLKDFSESVLEGDNYTLAEKVCQDSSTDNAKVEEIKENLSGLFNYLLSKPNSVVSIDGEYDILLKNIETDFFRITEGYSLVGYFGSGFIRCVYSYKDKYIILFIQDHQVSSFEIRFYDDIAIQSGSYDQIKPIESDVYYKLKVVPTDDVSESAMYEIEVVKYVESQN